MNYIAEWLDGYRRFWEARMVQLEEYVRKLQEKDRETAATKLKLVSKGESNDSKRK